MTRDQRAKRATELRLAAKLASKGYINSARALVKRTQDGAIVEVDNRSSRKDGDR